MCDSSSAKAGGWRRAADDRDRVMPGTNVRVSGQRLTRHAGYDIRW
jgi:hypothetical protein